MKINRINVVINAKENEHKKFLYNELSEFVKNQKLAAEFRPYTVKLNRMPESLTKLLTEAKIKWSEIKK